MLDLPFWTGFLITKRNSLRTILKNSQPCRRRAVSIISDDVVDIPKMDPENKFSFPLSFKKLFYPFHADAQPKMLIVHEAVAQINACARERFNEFADVIAVRLGVL